MKEVEVGGRRYVLDDVSGVRALTPEPDRGTRLVVDGRTVESDALRVAAIDLSPASDRLAWRLVGEGVDVGVVASGIGRGSAVRTDLTVAGSGRLERVEVERWPRAVTRGAGGGGLGQPAIGDGWYAALEHPGSEGLALPVDVDLGRDGPFAAPPFVVGACAPGHELSALWDEVDRIRARAPRLVVLANNWYQLGMVGRMDERSVVAEVSGFGRVRDQTGLALDWYCLDDPWDGEWEAATGLWGRLAPARFPGGLPALQSAARRAGIGGIGLWLSPWGGYFDRHDARVAWGGDHGYEVHGGGWPRLCPAGDTYRAHLAACLAAFTRSGVGYWKLDGVQFDCHEAGHGHPVGAAGRTAQMDRFAALLDGVRAVNPDVVLAFTTGSNPSPWWLRHADFVWRGGLDDDAPDEYEGGRHEAFATYVDSCLDGFRSTGVPVSAVVTFSLVENGVRAYRNDGEGLDGWERHCWLLAGRGTLHHDLYVAPDSLSASEWEVLARALGWARHYEGALARSRMVGGRPQAGEAYGFLSAGTDQLVACLRNPSARPQALSVPVDGEIAAIEAVYGPAVRVEVRGDASELAADLGPFDVALVTARWRRRTPPGLRG